MVLEILQNLSEKEQLQFEQTINKLLAETFIVKQKDNTKVDYYFIERHEQLFNRFLSFAGWQLDGERSYGVYAASNKYGRNRLGLHLVESIIILILRLIYEEKRQEISLNSDILIRVQELQDRYIALKIRNKPLGKTDLRETMKLLKKYNILDILDTDAAEPETRLLMYSSLLYAVRVENVNEIHSKLQSFSSSEEETDDDYSN